MKITITALLCALALCGCGDKGKHFDKKDGDRIEHSRFYVEEVTKDGDAIARWDEKRWINYEGCGRVLFLREEGSSYYDRQTINIPDDEYLVQIGSYTFEEPDERVLIGKGKEVMVRRTIPIVARRKHRP